MDLYLTPSVPECCIEHQISIAIATDYAKRSYLSTWQRISQVAPTSEKNSSLLFRQETHDNEDEGHLRDA